MGGNKSKPEKQTLTSEIKSMASSEKRCLYEILAVERDCTSDEIRSAYRKLALQRHPDKLVKSGVSEAEATAAFQELVNAYEVLSDPKERAWYDSHRSQILFASSSSSKSSKSHPDTLLSNLFSFFSNSVFSGFSDTGKGFYKVYGDVFDRIYQNELNFADKLGLGVGSVNEAPLIGNLKSPYTQTNAFYSYWLGFATVMDFAWVDQYDVMMGPNRKSRRLMEDENKKLRKKAKREYNDTVRGLADFAKKRDKRVIDMLAKKVEEMKKKEEEKREKKKQLQREKLERAMAFEEPDWAKSDEIEEEIVEEDESEKKNELYCAVCGKKFKSDKQWKNHEQSKKHKEKVAEFRAALTDEESESVEDEEEEEDEVLGDDVLADEELDGLQKKFQNGIGIQEPEVDDDEVDESSDEEVVVEIKNCYGFGEESDDDEASILNAMVKNRKNVGKSSKPKVSIEEVHGDIDEAEIDLMEYNNMKSSRRNKGGRRERDKRANEEAEKSKKSADDTKEPDESSHVEEMRSESSAESTSNIPEVIQTETRGKEGDNKEVDRSESSSKDGDRPEKSRKSSKQTADKKISTKKEPKSKSKHAGKQKKQKAADGHVCEKCGEDFESRNRLHKHLSDTGHSSLKSR